MKCTGWNCGEVRRTFTPIVSRKAGPRPRLRYWLHVTTCITEKLSPAGHAVKLNKLIQTIDTFFWQMSSEVCMTMRDHLLFYCKKLCADWIYSLQYQTIEGNNLWVLIIAVKTIILAILILLSSKHGFIQLKQSHTGELCTELLLIVGAHSRWTQ